MTPEFFAPGRDWNDKTGGRALNNTRVIFEILAGIMDPGYDYFPITPIGWTALALRNRQRELAGKEKQQLKNYDFETDIDLDDETLCSD